MSISTVHHGSHRYSSVNFAHDLFIRKKLLFGNEIGDIKYLVLALSKLIKLTNLDLGLGIIFVFGNEIGDIKYLVLALSKLIKLNS